LACGEGANGDGASGDGATGDGANVDGASGDGASGDAASGDGARGDEASGDEASGDGARGDEAVGRVDPVGAGARVVGAGAKGLDNGLVAAIEDATFDSVLPDSSPINPGPVGPVVGKRGEETLAPASTSSPSSIGGKAEIVGLGLGASAIDLSSANGNAVMSCRSLFTGSIGSLTMGAGSAKLGIKSDSISNGLVGNSETGSGNFGIDEATELERSLEGSLVGKGG